MKSAVMIIILVSMLFLGACSENAEQAISDTVTDFFTAYQNRQFSNCLDNYSQSLRTREGDSNLIQGLQDERTWDINFSLKSIGEPDISGANATVWIDYQSGLVVNSTQIHLIKEDSNWKINNIWQ